MKKQQLMGLLVAGLAVGLVGCGKTTTSKPSVAIYHQAKQGPQIWYEVSNYGKISGDKDLNAILVLKNNKLTEYGLAASIGYGDVKKVKDLRGYTDKEVIQLAKKWNKKSLEDEYESRYEDKNATTYVKPKYTKSEMVKKFLPKPVKVSYQLTETSDNRITSEVMHFSSPNYENGNVKYELIKTSDIKLAGGQKFIGYKAQKEVTGTTNKLKNQLIQRVPNSNRQLNYDSIKEPGITVKKAGN
ncbi:hypothetical protein C1940_17185 (plasmid) [Lactiplantibacillus plantarum subsp. plantarum]|uniref:hypothetical protein n=2 Tax=Lactiplantibacillus plantarum TaxID=1590 RepID=UPI000CD34C80|nr:hypothetical protein [Lactiplantibacillus plantarum]AUV74185.1 hypothetical protein C1940_17185 [Lactiplantibacillus plantarum subsp. plantarum]MCT3206439.1 hypothetical protein [Lactiplantibacillus plantarum]MCT3220213.1 hypothetical protein [Lactiplantibacillus plantarum]MCT3281511.1 hypothetical protein [Lactiplantibacillus plantarum]MYU99217.1 hypothetical protein [Lactiplantibacillus plantarum]